MAGEDFKYAVQRPLDVQGARKRLADLKERREAAGFPGRGVDIGWRHQRPRRTASHARDVRHGLHPTILSLPEIDQTYLSDSKNSGLGQRQRRFYVFV